MVISCSSHFMVIESLQNLFNGRLGGPKAILDILSPALDLLENAFIKMGYVAETLMEQ
jgi:hypothetical protein